MTSLSTTSKPEPQIICRGIVVEYELQRYRASTLKDAVIGTFKRRRQPNRNVHRALKGIDLEIQRGEFVAILGHNGSGKSTLLKVLCGILPPSQGTVATKGICVPLIELGAGFDPELTGRENIFLSLGLLGLNKKEIEERIPDIEDFSELGEFLDMPIKTYSSGMHMRLGFACSVCINADVLLIDEILAVGDENFQKKCINRMNEIRSSGTTMILVSHDANHAQQMADRVIVLDQGTKIFEGGPSDGVRFYHELMARKLEEAKPKHVRDEERRKKELIENDAMGIGLGEARLRKAILRSTKGRSILFPEDDGVLSIEFEILKELDADPCIGFAIHTSDERNLRILGGNTKLLSTRSSSSGYRRPGVYTATFNLKFLNLAAGSYKLITAIHSLSLQQTFDINTNALNFDIGNTNDPNNFDKDLVAVHSLVQQVEITNQYFH
ncbi:ABC transporter ATP-binding protein [Oligoflexus tunisiensis]|uniref:ABC transporter ATP-binding protein n=1 Tax=Oligoflexus tunisiensis TaxID=708132 RepID=UPI000AA4DAA4|nr:ABC transporter ATP-binding protein [Oligoflexus tunisiensis]